MNRFSKTLTIFTAMTLCLLTACSQSNDMSQSTSSQALTARKDICETFLEASILINPIALNEMIKSYVNSLDPIIGTWVNKYCTSTEMEKWLSLYTTRFSPDGQVEHYGNRNVDIGIWTRVDENTVTAYFNNCTYTGIGFSRHDLPSYQVTYTYDAENRTLSRKTSRTNDFTYEITMNNHVEQCSATDFDTYDKPLLYSSDEYTIEHHDYYPHYPEKVEYCTALEKALLSHADDLQAGTKVNLERTDLPYELQNVSIYDLTGDGKPEIFAYVKMCHHFDISGALYILSQKPDGEYTILAKNTDFYYSELLAPDGTDLLFLSIYRGHYSSSRGGHRIHIDYRENQVVVNCEEYYSFQEDYPLINYVNDYKNGKYYVYVSRENDTIGAGYRSYVGPAQSLKIDEETFSPMLIPFTGYDAYETGYSAVYHLWSPFDEDWWQDGASFPGDEDAYGRTADWSITAANDHPDEMLQEAVEKSGLDLKRTAYPWTPETKKNVMDLMCCPVADYYYISDYYAAAYIRGEIYFYKKEILPDGYQEEWVFMN